ncbi:hypothetical protein [Jatrophihabitans lederbergiae]|uniref:DUF5666 domain-containing protein n=1 Tax=Jatrophihabitans lederbergiae TaxID=3075547 RepID=A0ABU2JGH7_9ACTN|nr:hypothetical protein [Jatrophihabitans sp. DSM 44399]MDT0264092.1 hypothetical protein [Jatrophihabitans sp. DSM 44399]
MSLHYPAPPTPPASTGPGRGLTIGILGILAGGAAGVVIASTVGAGAATTASPGATDSSSSSNSGRGYHIPANSGTVSAVGTNSVTIKTTAGTTTYGVTSTSDIDKNGEAQLSNLAVGDAVTFNTQTVNGTTIIDKLHAGDEAKDRPAGPPIGTSTGG